MRLVTALVLAALLTSPSALFALEPPPPPPKEEPSPAKKALGVGFSLVPGLLVHGAGHMIMGDTDTGGTLLAAEGAGLGLTLGGIAGLAATGASPRTSSLFTGMAISGVGLFGISAMADLYGVLAPAEGFGAPMLRAPTIEVAAGYRFVNNPTFEFGHFTVFESRLSWNSFWLEPSAWGALDDDNRRFRLVGAWRILGPKTDALAADGSFLDLETGLTWHRYGTEQFSATTYEIALGGRLDLVRVSESLNGAFSELSFGYGLVGYDYDGIGTDGSEILLGRFAFGFYLGHDPEGWGEVSLYYDHRHDGFAEGLKASGLGSGNAGHFGIEIQKSIGAGLGVMLHGEVGSSVLGGVSLLYRMGGER